MISMFLTIAKYKMLSFLKSSRLTSFVNSKTLSMA